MNYIQDEKIGGIVLCGGKSRRMGMSKASLPFGSQTMLQLVIQILSEVLDPIVVVAAKDQSLTKLPDDTNSTITVVHDRSAGRGPLEGIAVGLSAIRSQCSAAFITSCDVPLLMPEFIRFLISKLSADGIDYEIVVPYDDQYHYPLAAVYRTSVLSEIEKLIDTERFRPVFLYDEVKTLRLPTDEIRVVDAKLHSLKNINQPQDYLEALEIANIKPQAEIITQLENYNQNQE